MHSQAATIQSVSARNHSSPSSSSVFLPPPPPFTPPPARSAFPTPPLEHDPGLRPPLHRQGSTSSHSSRHSLVGNRKNVVFVHSEKDEGVGHGYFWPGAGTVLPRIWPAVLGHTLFAAIITIVQEKTTYNLAVPNVMLTVLGLVVGFGISYRAANGFDRFQAGRTKWSDLIRTSRTLARVIWTQVPERITSEAGHEAETEKLTVRREKERFIRLIEAFAVATKHALRGEYGPYFEDLYPLICWLPQFHEPEEDSTTPTTHHVDLPTFTPTSQPCVSFLNRSRPSSPKSTVSPVQTHAHVHVVGSSSSYGTFSNHPPLLPARRDTSTSEPEAFKALLLGFSLFPRVLGHPHSSDGDSIIRKEQARIREDREKRKDKERMEIGGIKKYHPRLVREVDGVNIPLVIVGEMSRFVCMLERRGTVTGSTIGAAYSCVTAFEDSLTAMEQILTTPLPVVYSVHLRQTVWIYLLALPVQLVGQAGWFTIPVLSIASFLFLGFLAAGEELSQPFGFDANDLDLDLFTADIIRPDLEEIMKSPPPGTSKEWIVESACAVPASDEHVEIGKSGVGAGETIVEMS